MIKNMYMFIIQMYMYVFLYMYMYRNSSFQPDSNLTCSGIGLKLRFLRLPNRLSTTDHGLRFITGE